MLVLYPISHSNQFSFFVYQKEAVGMNYLNVIEEMKDKKKDWKFTSLLEFQFIHS